jgi:hypothetical protein
VDCTGSKIAVGGGSATNRADVYATDNPVDNNTWNASGFEISSVTQSWTVTVYAICVSP